MGTGQSGEGVVPLRQAFLDVMMEEPGTSLEVFLERVAAGDLGPRAVDEIVMFLRSVERDMIAGIYARAEASPELAAEVDGHVEEVQAGISELIERYGR